MSTVGHPLRTATAPPDTSRASWEALPPVPHAPVRGCIAERLFRHAVRDLPVRIALAGGDRLGMGGPNAPLMRISRPADFFQRVGASGLIGFGEGYMAEDWSSPEPATLLTPFAEHLPTLVPRPLKLLRRWVDTRRPVTERNTTSGAKRNIARHYDLSNDVFELFLDPSMTYSGAPLARNDHDLAAAQMSKLDTILDYAEVGRGTRLLEIGSGWGSLAIRAARRGARVTTVTLSEEQRTLALERIAAENVADLVDIRLCDYRDVTGQYDALVSVEMIEAVGAEYWPTYFRTIDRLLRPGGRLAVQAITMPHERMLATQDSYTWIHKYIFPGGLVPSIRVIDDGIRQHTELRSAQRRSFGTGYAETLQSWRTRFLSNWPIIAKHGFPEEFRRMWEFYLAYSEAGFRSHQLDVWQLAFRKPGPA
ncbi:cyclopropane-fatty-acyl-phospholipid synthase [Tamaricihabitans halophyticus]|uniref:Cyclopropane-fatty-acyl-phospholipid synthase n=1 Tax=Tamaricihabitans halophyticus TaxID=1262583 RepID=A0A4R2QCZ5_9PSEU|nr:cyclopropane-fatty-acyl-phospholipid synthase family protein [Tamaricihabitans halophyticus]TCP44775.1 cyclopropane-fatty-acyl-phospholipid synthase [Tamaricihabitans halophyticus]